MVDFKQTPDPLHGEDLLINDHGLNIQIGRNVDRGKATNRGPTCFVQNSMPQVMDSNHATEELNQDI